MPSELIERFIRKYAGCKTYSDIGEVQSVNLDGSPRTISFSTKYVRPNRLSFEWNELQQGGGEGPVTGILRSDGCRFLLRIGEKEEEKTQLSFAIAAAAGSSLGAAHVISSLLFEEVGSSSKNLAQLTRVKLLGSEEIGDCECDVFEAGLVQPLDVRIWIARHDFSLKILYRDMSDTTVRSANQTFTQPNSNFAVSESEFFCRYVYHQTRFDLPLDLPGRL